MAGAEKVTGRHPAPGRVLLLLVCLAAVSVRGTAAGRPQTVLLVERPQSLEVFNRYQQTATAEERSRLRPFAPLTVVRSEEMMPDGFTASMQVSVGGEIFYLVRDAAGALAGAGEAGRIVTVSGAEALGDTARTSTAVPAELAAGGARTIPAGTLVQRLLRAGGRTYVRVLRGDAAYCWIAGSHAALLHAYHDAAGPASARPTAVETSVRLKLAETNTVLRRLYGLLNARTGRTLPPPTWSVKPLPGALLCELSGAPGTTFTASTRFLAKDIENSLLGTGCHVETEPGRITVLLP